jgi:hypothetical protein
MPQVSATVELPGRISDAERLWYDLDRWPEWVDGLAEIIDIQGEWPKRGSTVVWQSTPAGRGRVTEEVIEYELRSGQVSQVQDDSVSGRQSVTFTPREQGLELRLALDYQFKRRSLVTPLVDLLFIRRLMGASLGRTLAQFQLLMGNSPSDPFG